jgi:opacity protein-like surface antigen
MPVPEGFTYYFRGDLGWGWASNQSYSETGLLYGQDAVAGFGPFTSSAIPFKNNTDTAFGGTAGVGAYFTPHIRGDVTIDFRADEKNEFKGNYAYPLASAPTSTYVGAVKDSLKLSSAVALANLYVEPLPRGLFTPYIGGGIGFVYNQITRSYLDTETLLDNTGTPVSQRARIGVGKDSAAGFAAALMAGVSFAIDHRWALDVGYRALYMDGRSSTITTPAFVAAIPPIQQSVATLSGSWEHEIRVGVRFNVW